MDDKPLDQPQESPLDAPQEQPQGKTKGWSNLKPGLPENVDRGPDGRLKRKETLGSPSSRPFAGTALSHADLLRAVDWVYQRLDFAEGDIREWPIPGTKTMWQMAKADPSWFYQNMVVKLLPKPEEGGSMPKWDGKGPCPVCKREPLAKDEGTERAIKLADKWLKDRKARLADQEKLAG